MTRLYTLNEKAGYRYSKQESNAAYLAHLVRYCIYSSLAIFTFCNKFRKWNHLCDSLAKFRLDRTAGDVIQREAGVTVKEPRGRNVCGRQSLKIFCFPYVFQRIRRWQWRCRKIFRKLWAPCSPPSSCSILRSVYRKPRSCYFLLSWVSTFFRLWFESTRKTCVAAVIAFEMRSTGMQVLVGRNDLSQNCLSFRLSLYFWTDKEEDRNGKREWEEDRGFLCKVTNLFQREKSLSDFFHCRGGRGYIYNSHAYSSYGIDFERLARICFAQRKVYNRMRYICVLTTWKWKEIL